MGRHDKPDRAIDPRQFLNGSLVFYITHALVEAAIRLQSVYWFSTAFDVLSCHP